jgi:ComF family protein
MFTHIIDRLASALPSQCVVCHSWGQHRVCQACIRRFTGTSQRCLTCALPLAGKATRCGECLQHSIALDGCLAAVDYTYPWDSFLVQLKFKGRHRNGPDASMAKAIADTMRGHSAITAALLGADVIIPIPLSTQRLQQRGFNQALEITKHLLSSAPSDRAKLQPQLLVRARDTAAQTGLARAQRLLNLRHAFMVEPLSITKITGAKVVLIDDVTTTTATLCAAAQALRSAGAAHVVGVVFARTLASS